jgi:hypothetical protein
VTQRAHTLSPALKVMPSRWWLAVCFLPVLPLHAQLVKDLPRTESEPPRITADSLRNDIGSTVDIISRENHQVEEYRVGSNVYMMKVKPRGAPPYYLIDEDGSGRMQWRRGGELEQVSPPRWAILKW